MNASLQWNKVYLEGHSDFFQFDDQQLKSILEWFPHAHSALDIGCGRGELLVQLESRGLEVSGIDPSIVALRQAWDVCVAPLYLGEFENYPIPSSYDLIFAKFVVAFLEPKIFVEKVKKLLNPGGGLVILSPVSPRGGGVFARQSFERFLAKHFEVEEVILEQEGPKKLSLYIAKVLP